jgi:coproporphyrinogen III oxidase-like Fe-S oxidoreductase
MSNKVETSLTIFGGQVQAETFEANDGGHRLPLQDMIRHIYVHIPFCARICPYCAFYKELLDRSQTQRFCDAVLRELGTHARDRSIQLTTIYFGGGTPTALT